MSESLHFGPAHGHVFTKHLRVTFDTNTLDPVTRPRLAGAPGSGGGAIYRALQSKRLEGFFCETVVTVEGSEPDLRAAMLGSVRVGEPLRPETLARMRRALDMGMRILSAPRIGGIRIEDPTGELYVKESDEAALSLRLERYRSLATAIEARGLGFARVSRIAAAAGRAATSGNGIASPHRVTTPGDIRKVARAVAEWADGDSVAAHYGYGNDFYCTEDRARKAGRHSVMHPAHRHWLRRSYGVNVVSIAELDALLRA